MNQFKVSVLMITYCQEKFIEEAILGVLSQKCDFEIELIIADDCSPDNTEKIVCQIQSNHPNGHWIKYTRHTQNKGILSNFIWAAQESTGKYIALCEGDDYWTDSLKLQLQTDFLESNDDFVMCFHSVNIRNEFKNTVYPEIIAQDRTYSSDELLLTKTAHTVSFLYRNDMIDKSIKIDRSVFSGDVLLALLMSDRGKVFGMKQNMANYRMHALGVTNTIPLVAGISHHKRLIRQYIYFRKTNKLLSKKATSQKIVDHCMTLALFYYKSKSFKAFKYVLIAIYYDPMLIIKGLKKIFK